MNFMTIRGIFSRCVFLMFGLATVFGQAAGTNSWTKSSSGNWEEPFWSLGQLPSHDQAGVAFNNPGWKALAIGANTTANFPGSLSISNLLIESPTDSANQLLLNHAGVAVPLSIEADLRVVGTNSSLVSHYSALRAANFYLGGVAIFDELSEGNFGQVAVGADGSPGQLNLLNGFAHAGSVAVNGQSTLTVSSGCIVDIGSLALNLPATGGVAVVNVSGSLGVSNVIDIGLGNITVSGGYFQTPGITVFKGELRQSGGTNDSGSIRLPRGRSSGNGEGTFYLSGGTLLSSTLSLGDALPGGFVYYNGVFEQTGGLHSNSVSITTWGVERQAQRSIAGTYRLRAGVLITSSIQQLEAGGFEQSGGTNRAGTITVRDASSFELSGGLLLSSNVVVGPGDGAYNYWSALQSVYTQTGGNHVVATEFSTIEGGVALLRGGSLTAPGISVGPEGGLALTGAAVTNSGTFTLLSGARLRVDGNYPRLGKLIVNTGAPPPGFPVLTNHSLLNFEMGAATLRFRESQDVSWDSQLVVTNWSGLLNGGGTDRLYVGTSSQGLTPDQLSRIHFVNPPGLPPGSYSAAILATGEVVPTSGQIGGSANNWIKPISGDWDDLSAWSLGVLPNATQSVQIANSGWKAVAIRASTPINFPASMTVGSLAIRGAWDTMNTLLLDHVGTAVPLTVTNGLTVQDMARIVNFNSALVVQGGTILFTNAEIIQDFGLVRATNAPMTIQNSQYHLTNGLFEAGQVLFGWPVSAGFNQYGGTAVISDLRFGQGAMSAGGACALHGGDLRLPGGMSIVGGNNSFSSYLQTGGTNRTTSVFLEPGLYGLSPSFTLNGGLLADDDVTLLADNFGSITLSHNGGTHIVTNTLNLAGATTHGTAVREATYHLNGGILSARAIVLDGRQGDALFVQSNGVAQAELIQGAGDPNWYFGTRVVLAGGTLACSNLLSGARSGIDQFGGALVVSNTLDFRTHLFLGGTVNASNINARGYWIIGSSGVANRITNRGNCALSGTLQISNALEQLGRFILASNATIDLAGNASRLSFANSSGEAWNSAATLVVNNWNGNPSGGGAEQLKFGTSQSGLTPAQLSRIRFDSSSNLFPAKILNTGEVVPNQEAGASVGVARQGTSLVLTWPQGWSLQMATNIAGPFFDIPEATSPYSNNVTGPRRFFRLRQ
jgi:hypothetical protein